MLSDRGLDVENVHFSHFFKDDTIKTIHTIEIDNVKIVYYLTPKFKWSDAKTMFEDSDANKNIILVVASKVSAANLKSIHSMLNNIQIFELKELQFNISKHELVPKHELITSEEEINDLLKSLNIKTKFYFPHILKSDPMSKYMGLKNGDVLRITRRSPTAGEYIAYRVCM
jgi:DNA-directed RNA polymerase subunit H (RpoH/RPB5)